MVSVQRPYLKFIQSIVNAIEDPGIPFINFFFTFFAVIGLRYLGEGFSESYYYLNVSSFLYLLGFIHTLLFYITVAIGLIGILQFATGEALTKSTRFVLTAFTIILMTPLLDLLIQPHGADNMYLHPGMGIHYLYSYLSLFGGFSGISVGLRTEIFVVFFGFIFYLRVKQINWVKSLCYAWLCYTLIFIVASSPMLLQMLFRRFGIPYLFQNAMMNAFFILMSLMFALIIYLCHSTRSSSTYVLYLYRFFSQGELVMLGGMFALYTMPDRVLAYSSFVTLMHICFALLSFMILACSGIGFSNWNQDAKDNVVILLAIVVTVIMNINLFFFFMFYVLLSCLYSWVKRESYDIVALPQLIVASRSLILLMMGYTLLGSGG